MSRLLKRTPTLTKRAALAAGGRAAGAKVFARAKPAPSTSAPPSRILTRTRSTPSHSAACASGPGPSVSTRHFARATSSAMSVGRRVTLTEAVAAGKRRLPPGLETPGGISFEEGDLDDGSSGSEDDAATLKRRQTSVKRRKTLDRFCGLGVDGSALDADGLSYLELGSVQPKSEAIYRDEMVRVASGPTRSTSAERRTPLWRSQS